TYSSVSRARVTGTPASDQERERRRARRDRLDAQRARLHAGQERLEVAAAQQLHADQRRTGLPVALLHVLEQGDVVVRAEHLVQEPAQRTRLLGELDQEVVLEALVH